MVFLGSPYGANPSTAGLWESAPKGRGGVFADTLNVCPRRRAPRHGWRGWGVPKAEELRQGRRERLVRSAPGSGTADAGGEPETDDGPVDRRPGERAHRDVRPGLSRGAGCVAGKFAPSGVSFFLVAFSWTSKKKLPAVGQPPTSTRRLQGGSTRAGLGQPARFSIEAKATC